MSFKTGDLVYLRSGGPILTVGKVEGEIVYCCWFIPPGQLAIQMFHADMLAHFEDAMRFPQQDPVSEERPSQEKRVFHGEDQLLRCAGFTIYSRPPGQPPKWLRGGQIFTQEEALATCRSR